MTLIERSASRKIKCPLCRRNIDLIMMSDQLRNSQETEKKRIVAVVKNYNTRNSSDMSFSYFFSNLPFLLNLTMQILSSPQNIRVILGLSNFLFYFGGLLFYLISPLDLIPEAIWGIFGLIDDFFVFGIIFILVSIQIFKAVRSRNQN